MEDTDESKLYMQPNLELSDDWRTDVNVPILD